MSKCSIRIELDRHDPTYKIGDRINCIVHVAVDKPVKCDGLTIHKFWYTHGRGNRSSGGDENQILFKGEWQRGEYEYPCSFDIGSGPLSYHGRYINIDWQLEARADIPWAFDPKVSREFLVERGEPINQLIPEEKHLDLQSLAQGRYRVFAMLIPLILALVGGGFVISGLMQNELFDVLIGTGFLIGGVVLGYFTIRNTIAQRKLGQVDVNIDPPTLRPGESTDVSMNFVPQVAIQINQIKARLVGKEWAVSGSGTNRSTHTHKLYNEEFPLAGKCQFDAGETVRHQLAVSIPQGAPHTFIESDNSIRWFLEFSIDIDDWPDWVSTKPVYVMI